MALETAVMRALPLDAHDSGSIASLLKVPGSELRQDVADLADEALGDRGLAVALNPDPQQVMFDDGLTSPVPDHGIGVAAKTMFRRATAIYGGANEIQRTLIAKTVLEL